MRYYCRFFNEGAFKWVEVDIVFYVNEDGDLCDFTLLRWADERSQELDQLSVSKALELAVNSSFEYICIIDVPTGSFSRYGKNTAGNHLNQKSYDEGIKRVQDRISPENRAEYYSRANLNNVVGQLEAGNSSYSFSYTLPEGDYTATFDWLDSTHTKLILTVNSNEM